jgi:hypothetical protein
VRTTYRMKPRPTVATNLPANVEMYSASNSAFPKTMLLMLPEPYLSSEQF